jgi:hypothetical protein
MHRLTPRRLAALVVAACCVAAGCNDTQDRDADVTGDTGVNPEDTGLQPDASIDDSGNTIDMDAGDDASDAAPMIDVTYDAPLGTDPLPAFDSETDAHVRDLITRGVARGNHPEVFAKIGDSITESASYLFDCGYGWIHLGDHPEMGPTIQYFSQFQFGDRNSMNRASLSAVAGWSASQALENYPDAPLVQELNAISPLYAVVMYGTNDLERVDVPTYLMNMNRIVDIIEMHDTVPVLSTIPPRMDGEPYASRVLMWNDAIRSLAQARHVPLIDFWLALQQATGYGMSPDGIHPAVYVNPADPNTDGCDFSGDALQFGYNVRNLTTLQMLTRLRTYTGG